MNKCSSHLRALGLLALLALPGSLGAAEKQGNPPATTQEISAQLQQLTASARRATAATAPHLQGGGAGGGADQSAVIVKEMAQHMKNMRKNGIGVNSSDSEASSFSSDGEGRDPHALTASTAGRAQQLLQAQQPDLIAAAGANRHHTGAQAANRGSGRGNHGLDSEGGDASTPSAPAPAQHQGSNAPGKVQIPAGLARLQLQAPRTATPPALVQNSRAVAEGGNKPTPAPARKWPTVSTDAAAASPAPTQHAHTQHQPQHGHGGGAADGGHTQKQSRRRAQSDSEEEIQPAAQGSNAQSHRAAPAAQQQQNAVNNTPSHPHHPAVAQSTAGTATPAPAQSASISAPATVQGNSNTGSAAVQQQAPAQLGAQSVNAAQDSTGTGQSAPQPSWLRRHWLGTTTAVAATVGAGAAYYVAPEATADALKTAAEFAVTGVTKAADIAAEHPVPAALVAGGATSAALIYGAGPALRLTKGAWNGTGSTLSTAGNWAATPVRALTRWGAQSKLAQAEAELQRRDATVRSLHTQLTQKQELHDKVQGVTAEQTAAARTPYKEQLAELGKQHEAAVKRRDEQIKTVEALSTRVQQLAVTSATPAGSKASEHQRAPKQGLVRRNAGKLLGVTALGAAAGATALTETGRTLAAVCTLNPEAIDQLPEWAQDLILPIDLYVREHRYVPYVTGAVLTAALCAEGYREYQVGRRNAYPALLERIVELEAQKTAAENATRGFAESISRNASNAQLREEFSSKQRGSEKQAKALGDTLEQVTKQAKKLGKSLGFDNGQRAQDLIEARACVEARRAQEAQRTTHEQTAGHLARVAAGTDGGGAPVASPLAAPSASSAPVQFSPAPPPPPMPPQQGMVAKKK